LPTALQGVREHPCYSPWAQFPALAWVSMCDCFK
jgi:hypothetical protein